MDMALDDEALDFIIDHVVFPPKLPQKAESDEHVLNGEKELLRLILEVAGLFEEHGDGEAKTAWASIFLMLKNCHKVLGETGLSQGALNDVLLNLEGPVCIHIRAQNAGLLFRTTIDDQVIVDGFEASAQSGAVTGTKGRLVRAFPGRSVVFPRSQLQDLEFTSELTNWVRKLYQEHVPMQSPTTRKAGKDVTEERDTPHPGLVTESLMSILAAYGDNHNTPTIQKNVRDEVNWDNTMLPWRRSAFWLVIRVSMQLLFNSLLPAAEARRQYKNFAALIIAKICEIATKKTVSHDVQMIINIKAARRLSKLGGRCMEFVETAIHDAVSTSRTTLEAAWSKVQEADKRFIERLPTKANETDAVLPLRNSSDYLRKIIEEDPQQPKTAKFLPPCGETMKFSPDGLPDLSNFDSPDISFLLVDFEGWVLENLNPWREGRSPSDSDCATLQKLMSKYVDLAKPKYDGNSRAYSIMLLVVLEIWRALDIVCLKLYPLMADYSPEISPNLAEPLLLPQLFQMERLQCIEDHIRKRKSNTDSRDLRILEDPKDTSFCIRYYDQAQELQMARRQIEAEASVKRERKKKNFEESSALYERLMAEASPLEHQKGKDWRGYEVHLSSCCKCDLEGRAKRIEIRVHEWPLPQNEVQTKAAVFELMIPKGFAAWRDATWLILQDLGRRLPTSGTQAYERLTQYGQLNSYAFNHGQRLSLVSYTKSFIVSHYGRRGFPAQLEDVCVNNGLRYQLLDITRSVIDTLWIKDQEDTPSFAQHCNTRLPAGPYVNLQDFVDTATQTSNECIARQEQCSSGISEHEFLAFASLRSGERLQWMNVLRELASSDLSLNNEAVFVLIQQATLQVGSQNPETVLREPHSIFEDVNFCTRLLEILNERLDEVKSNWKEQTRVALLTLLTTRLLSITSNEPVANSARDLLRRIRAVLLDWSRELTAKLPGCTTDESNRKLKTEIIRATTSGIMTFDIDRKHLSSILKDNEDVACAVEMMVYLNNNAPVRLEDLPHGLQKSLLLNERVSRNIEPHLRELILRSDGGMDHAVNQVSGIGGFAGNWTVVHSGPERRWITNVTKPKTGGISQKLHYNILTGELLVDGRPLGRLPREYTEKSLYRRVFGSRILSVSASERLHYKSVKLIEGHEVHLGLVEGELVIKAIAGDRCLRVVPPEIWGTDLPMMLQQDFVHWMDTATSSIEFRPLKQPWRHPTKEILLKFSLRSTMTLGRSQLLDSGSGLGSAISSILGTVETIGNIIITSGQDGSVGAELPRFGLKFFINADGLLESKELSAVVEQHQEIGCLIGLRSKLIFRSCSPCPEIAEKSVLIPYGKVRTSAKGNHRLVRVENADIKKVKFMHFRLDGKLAKLRSGPEAAATLYKAYLHALTSSVLPDPFTEQTGAQEALSILRESSLRSPSRLSDEALRLLNNIASLTCHRAYYPEHKRVMQTAKWKSDICQFIQNEDFNDLAQDIMSNADQFAKLSGDLREMKLRGRGSSELHERAAVRGRTTLNLHLGCQQRTGDRTYSGRDADSNSPGALRVHNVAVLIRKWPSKMDVINDLPRRIRHWNKIQGYHQMNGKSYQTINDILEFPVGKKWGALYDMCRSARRHLDSHKLTLFFCHAAYGQPDLIEILHTLLAIAFSGRFTNLTPEHNSYNLAIGEKPKKEEIRHTAQNGCKSFYESDWTGTTYRERKHRYDAELYSQLEFVAQHTSQQWPCDRPSLPSRGVDLLNIYEASNACASKFTAWNKNRKFIRHIQEVQERLDLINGPVISIPQPFVVPSADLWAEDRPIQICPDLMRLFSSNAAPAVETVPTGMTLMRERIPMQPHSSHDELYQILNSLHSTPDETRKKYAEDLNSSLKALQAGQTLLLPQFSIPTDKLKLRTHRESQSQLLHRMIGKIEEVLQPKDKKSNVLKQAGLWPACANVHSLLAHLSSKRFNSLSFGWKQALTSLGEVVSLLQRAERLLGAFSRRDVVAFYKESEEPGRQGWSAMEYPDWLLIEIENNLTIRHMQAIVAMKMMSPESSMNSVLQLNMGEGKSSVIIPMVTAALADGKQIARLIVLKPLLKQTQTLLAQRLGGLVDRRIYHVPFSRQTRPGTAGIINIREIFEECMTEGGVLIALPEHILSFRLMGREIIHKGDKEAKSMISTERWLQNTCRSILDESDEILDSRFQLVYSMGTQRMLDGQPDRWLVIQSILGIFADQAKKLRSPTYDGLLEVDYRERSYPFLSFLDPGAGEKLLDLVVQKISEGHLIGVSFDHCSQSTRQLVLKFIRERHISHEVFSSVEAEFRERPLWNKLHLLRGLIAFNILLFAFEQKRWLVDYGLSLNRCLMAVPYRAKGVPSLRAEFGHPDVAITLTCLSYYYGGLTPGQLRQSFDLLMKESDPPGEYFRWVKDRPDLPRQLRSLHAVNLDDGELWESQLYPQLKFSKAAADFFMSKVVFPHEGKEFPQKLSASAWDIPSHNPGRITTGFSGTNDNKFLLPLSIKQHDLPQLHGTNAMVVNLLLQKDNRQYIEPKDQAGKRLSVQDLLSLVSQQDPPIQVLIDVGAQVLEARNQDVAKEWLRLCPSAEASVFFNDADEVMVMDREGFLEKLSSSAFSNRLENCLVYLDEVHTRGIDLSLPTHARAAVTLGPRLTKDRLVQACMRMRKLGCHQSLVFFAPPEVHRGILETSPKTNEDELDSSDVVRWCLEQTCRATDTMKPLWLAQGLEFRHRHRLSSALLGEGVESAFEDSEKLKRFHSDIQEPEGRSLEEMYGSSADAKILRSCLIDEDARQDPEVQELLYMWNSFTTTNSGDCVLQEEQEREISHEVEQERQVQRPPPAKPRRHEIHPNVVAFIRTGLLPELRKPAFLDAFESLKQTSAYQHLHADLSSMDLLVTNDFAQTVGLAGNSRSDQFLRPVKWILSSKETDHLVIVSPYEANELLPDIKGSQHVGLHVYTSRTSKAMRGFSDLKFFTTPSSCSENVPGHLVVSQLELFAGSLFFQDYPSYKAACDSLGLLTKPPSAGGPEVRVDSDGFVDEKARRKLDWPVRCIFRKSPLVFLEELVGIRRKGQTYFQTHLGHLVSGRRLTQESFGSA